MDTKKEKRSIVKGEVYTINTIKMPDGQKISLNGTYKLPGEFLYAVKSLVDYLIKMRELNYMTLEETENILTNTITTYGKVITDKSK